MTEPKPPFRLTKRNRRVLLVLLSGASNLYPYSLCRAAGTGSGTVYPLLERLESAGWVHSEWGPVFTDDGLRRRFYALTFKGRYQALRLLGLEEAGE